MKAFFLDLFDLFFPRLCASCEMPLQKQENCLCIYCRISLPKTNFQSSVDNSVFRLFAGRADIEQADVWLYFVKKGMVQKLMYQLKYKGNYALGVQLGYWYGLDLKSKTTIQLPDCFCVVPLHRKKLKLRGYNQALAIAEGMSKALNIPVFSDALLRTKLAASQTRKKRFQRWQDAVETYSINPHVKLKDMQIGLVDDVVTTGATIEICANLLKNEGVAQVHVFALCQAIN